MRASAGRLVQACLNDVRKQGLNVVPLCPYVRDWMAAHPGYADLVQAEDRADFGL